VLAIFNWDLTPIKNIGIVVAVNYTLDLRKNP
jgi:hypothetical protein